MSDNHPYPRHHQHDGTNTNYRNENEDTENHTNRNDNNYHLRNPYSPHGKISQQQQQQQQQQKQHPNPSWQNSNQGDINNPYSQRTKRNDAQQQKSNQGNNIRSNNSSFAIKPGAPRDGHQKQHHHQQSLGNELNVTQGSRSRPVLPQTNAQQQPIQGQQKEQNDSNILLDKLREQLDQSNESNFELEASVMALEAELQHTKQALKERADSERSKLEHELRLAQQESKRWKLLAQQQQQQKGRSIVRDANFQETIASVPSAQSTSASTFSNRLLGDSAGLRPSSPKKKKADIEDIHDNHEHFSIDQNSLEISDESLRRHKFSPKEQLGRQNLQVCRLARNLLEQLEPLTGYVGDSTKSAPSLHRGSKRTQSDADLSKTTHVAMDIEEDEKDHREYKKRDDDDASIRRILLSIATDSNENLDPPFFQYNQDLQNPELSPSFKWSEGKLLEWLVVTFSSESSDRYWSMLLLQSSEARKYVAMNVCWNWVPELEGSKIEQQPQHITILHPRKAINRHRRSRIRPLTPEGDIQSQATNLSEWQKQARQSLHNPWWTPKDIVTPNVHAFSSTNCTKSVSLTQKASSLAFRKWVTSLSASWNPRHLHTLRVLLAEEAGRKEFAVGSSDHDSGAWWSLCYSSVANTLQRIILTKLSRSKRKRGKGGFIITKPTSSRSNLTQRSNASSNGKNRNRRNRIGRFEERLERLTEGKGISDVHCVEEEDKILSYALCVWMGLMQVASQEQLERWYEDRTGLDIAKHNTKERQFESSEQPCGGLFMVSILLDLLDELQFDQWGSKADAMSLSQILSTGVIVDQRKLERGIKRESNGSNRAIKEKLDGFDKNDWDISKQSSHILPHWYNTLIATLTQIGKTRGGMKILRSRVKDYPEKTDWMGNALDVSLRHLHTLSLHLDNVRTRHGSIVRFDVNNTGDSDISDRDVFCSGDPLMVSLLRSVEAWVRFWHQILLFAQSAENISFRALVLDLQDWFTSACATLLASEEVNQEIKAMIRWQLDELMMDEEDYEESRRQLDGRN